MTSLLFTLFLIKCTACISRLDSEQPGVSEFFIAYPFIVSIVRNIYKVGHNDPAALF